MCHFLLFAFNIIIIIIITIANCMTVILTQKIENIRKTTEAIGSLCLSDIC